MESIKKNELKLLSYFWTFTGFFLTFLCLGFANMDEDAKVEKEKLLGWPATGGCCRLFASSSSNPMGTTGSGSTAILLNLLFLWDNKENNTTSNDY